MQNNRATLPVKSPYPYRHDFPEYSDEDVTYMSHRIVENDGDNNSLREAVIFAAKYFSEMSEYLGKINALSANAGFYGISAIDHERMMLVLKEFLFVSDLTHLWSEYEESLDRVGYVLDHLSISQKAWLYFFAEIMEPRIHEELFVRNLVLSHELLESIRLWVHSIVDTMHSPPDGEEADRKEFEEMDK